MQIIDTQDWDRGYEQLVACIGMLPPTLLHGMMRHVTKELYRRGVVGMMQGRNYAESGQLMDPGAVDGQVSAMVQQAERELQDELAGRMNRVGVSYRHSERGMTPRRVVMGGNKHLGDR